MNNLKLLRLQIFFFIVITIIALKAAFADLTIIEPNQLSSSPKDLEYENQILEDLQNENFYLQKELQYIRSLNKTRSTNYSANHSQKVLHSKNRYRLDTKLSMNELVKRAKKSKKVIITVFTDSDGYQKKVRDIAMENGYELKKKFINHGISSEKIDIQLLTGSYIAPNSSMAGREKNRRIIVKFQ